MIVSAVCLAIAPIVAMARLFLVLNRSFEYCDLAQVVATEAIKPMTNPHHYPPYIQSNRASI